MWTRRTVIATTSAGMLLAGCLGNDDGSGDEGDEDNEADDGGYDTRLDEIDDYDPIDRTGEEDVEIEVSPDDEPPFDPDAVMVDTLATIRWTWSDSDGEISPVEIPGPCQWSGSDGGTSHSWEFAFEGKYEIGYSAPESEEVVGVVFVVDSDE